MPKRRDRSKSPKQKKRHRSSPAVKSEEEEAVPRAPRQRGAPTPPSDPLPQCPPPLPGMGGPPPMMPMLHAVMHGVVRLVTGKGAILQLTDGGPMRYMDGLLKKRASAKQVRTGQVVFVKVVRLEPGLVVVDSQTIDQKTGKDNDPFNEQAEVEDWIDVPSSLVGHIIGKGGARIRTICEQSGADLRFDELVTAPPPPPGVLSNDPASQTPQPRRIAGSGGGDDLRRFLEVARDASSQNQENRAPQALPRDPAGDDLRKFLEDARADDGRAGDGGADDLKRFLDDARGDKDGSGRAKVVEFTADDHKSWEQLMMRNMEDAGIAEVYIENLAVCDKRGRKLDIAKGLKPKHFPIHVRYAPPDADTTTTSKPTEGKVVKEEDESDKPQKQEQKRAKQSAVECAEAYLERMKEEEFEDERVPIPQTRPETVHIAGAINLWRTHIAEVLEAKGLPQFKNVEHPSKEEVVCIFESPEDASAVLDSLRQGFDDVEEEDSEGPGLYRARRGMLTYRHATTADVKPEKQPKPQKSSQVEPAIAIPDPVMRLRVNGDARDVAKARAAVLGLLDEFLNRKTPLPAARPAGGRGGRLLPGEVKEHVEIPSKKVGRVIGKGGETIRKLEADSGARLRLAPAGDLRDGDFQEMSLQGSADAVAKAKELLEDIVGVLPGAPKREADSPPREQQDAKRRRVESPVRTDPAVASKVRELADELERTRAKREEDSDLDEEVKIEADAVSSDSSVSSRTRRRRVRTQKKEMERKEIELYLKRQKELDAIAAAAEAEAAELTALASQQPEGTEADVAGKHGLTHYWLDETETCQYVDMPAATPYGAGRISRAVSTQDARYLTISLLAGGTVQALESVVLDWIEDIRKHLGTCVLRPSAALPKTDAQPKSSSWVHQWEHAKARLLASGSGLVVEETIVQGTRFAYNLMPFDNSSSLVSQRAASILRSSSRIIDVQELPSWPRADSIAYLVDLCATPKSLGHVVLCRHDYRISRGTFSKGDMVVMEGARRNARDVGVVRKVLSGVKAEKAAKASSTATRLSCGSADAALLRLKRVFRKCTDEERQRREGPMASLEASTMPLLSARLPKGAEALGIGLSLDGTHMRMFVNLGSDREHAAAVGAAAATAAATIGAMFGCEAELFMGDGPGTGANDATTGGSAAQSNNESVKPVSEAQADSSDRVPEQEIAQSVIEKADAKAPSPAHGAKQPAAEQDTESASRAVEIEERRKAMLDEEAMLAEAIEDAVRARVSLSESPDFGGSEVDEGEAVQPDEVVAEGGQARLHSESSGGAGAHEQNGDGDRKEKRKSHRTSKAKKKEKATKKKKKKAKKKKASTSDTSSDSSSS